MQMDLVFGHMLHTATPCETTTILNAFAIAFGWEIFFWNSNLNLCIGERDTCVDQSRSAHTKALSNWTCTTRQVSTLRINLLQYAQCARMWIDVSCLFVCFCLFLPLPSMWCIHHFNWAARVFLPCKMEWSVWQANGERGREGETDDREYIFSYLLLANGRSSTLRVI